MTTVFNTTEGPLLLDEEGHSVGGGEKADTTLTTLVRDHLSSGRLVKMTQAIKTTESTSKEK